MRCGLVRVFHLFIGDKTEPYIRRSKVPSETINNFLLKYPSSTKNVMGCKEVSRSGVFVCETFQDLVLLKIEWGERLDQSKSPNSGHELLRFKIML